MAETKEPVKRIGKVTMSGTPIFEWKSAEFLRQERDGGWYIAATGIFLLVEVSLIWIQQWTGVILAAIAFFYLIFAGLKPKNHSCQIYEKGVVLDDQVFSFSEFKSFWIAFSVIPKLYLQHQGRFAGQVVMPLGDIELEKVRAFVGQHLPEDEGRGEDLADIINRWIKF